MGNLCQSPDLGITADDIVNQSRSKIRVDPSKNSITLPFIVEPLYLGKKLGGFTCDGGHILKSGCKLGEVDFAASQNLQAYFSLVNDIAFCQDCAKNVLDTSNLKDQWWGYSKRADKVITNHDLKALVVMKNYIGGYGDGFIITGKINPKDDHVKLTKTFIGDYQYDVTYIGSINSERTTISGKAIVDTDLDEIHQFKLCKIPQVKYLKPFSSTKIPSGNMHLTTHKCALKGPSSSETGWACDGRKDFGTKCIDGISDFYQTNGVEKYNCAECDYDLCLECVRFQLWADQVLANTNQTWTGFYEYDGTKSDMTFEKLVISQGVILGKGTDEVGDFYINGYQKGLKIKYIKKYHGQHTVQYKGTIENGNVVKGRWNIEETTGEFELHLQA